MIYRADLSKKPQEGKKKSLFPFKKAKPPVPQTNPALLKQPLAAVNPIAAPAAKPRERFSFKLFAGLVLLFLLVFGGLFAFDRILSYSSRIEKFDEDGNPVETCNNLFNPKCWTEAFRPQLKQENGYTTALIIGVDTRTGKSSLMNTDSLIAVTFNHETQEFMMTSIPRDFWSNTYSTKINAVYAYTYQKGKQKQNDEFYYLKEEISKIIDKPIQYTAKVRLEGVINLVDRLGGVEVCTQDAFTAKYPNDYPKPGESQWLSFEFSKGCQTLDGEKALVYSRFRYLYKGPSYLASDFSRGKRQQEVIDAIKVKALSEDVPLEQRAENYWSLFQSFGEMIEIDISFEDMLAGLAYIDSFDRSPIKTVLDPNFGGINRIIYTDSNPTQGYTIKSKTQDYSGIHKELEKIWESSAFYRETPNIVVRNLTGEKTLPSNHPAVTLKTDTAFYSSYFVYNEAESDTLFGVHLFDFTNGAKPKSLEFLKEYLKIETVENLPEEFGIERSKKNEDFLIVVGPLEPSSTPVTETPTQQ